MSNKWVVFDADDTLWRTTPLYDLASKAVVDMIAVRGHDPAAVSEWADARDIENAKEMGYSMHRFPRTMRETAAHFLGEGEPAWAALGMGYNVFASVAEPTHGIADVLSALASGGWRLAVLTAGEATVQEKRLRDFAHVGAFAATRVVPKKDAAVFRALAADLGINPALSWVVGDSLRSDVLPAIEAGFSAIHYETMNWHGYEIHGHEKPAGVRTVGSLASVPAIVSGTA